MYLRQRGGGDGRLLEVVEDVVEGALQLAFDDAADDVERARRDGVLEAGEDVDVLVGDEVGAGADDLAELDEEALAADGDVVEAVGGPGVVPQPLALGLLVAEAEALLADAEPLVAEVDAGGEGGDGESAAEPGAELHSPIMGDGRARYENGPGLIDFAAPYLWLVVFRAKRSFRRGFVSGSGGIV